MLTLLETVPFAYNRLWTQDSPNRSLNVGGKAGPYIDQGGSKLKVLYCSPKNKSLTTIKF